MITVHNRGRVRIKLSTNYDAVEMSEPLSKFISHVALCVKNSEANEKKNKLCYHFFQGLNHATEWLIYKTMESVHMAIMRWNCFLYWMVCVGSMRAIECISCSSDLAKVLKVLAIAAKRKQIKLFESELNCWISEFVECSLILSTLPDWMMNESFSVTIKLKHQLQMFTRLRN